MPCKFFPSSCSDSAQHHRKKIPTKLKKERGNCNIIYHRFCCIFRPKPQNLMNYSKEIPAGEWDQFWQ